MYELYQKSLGEAKAFEICRYSLEKPSLSVRANTLKTTPQDLIKKFKNEYGYKVAQCHFAPNGIRFLQKPVDSLFSLQEFRNGHFEIQDEGSQLLAMRVDCRPKQTVLDYCGGAGGKSLAFAPFM